MNKWINVEERLPKNFETVLCRMTGGAISTGFCVEAIWHIDRQTIATVTHWMSLPEPPEEEINNDQFY